jgi:hypothetical protein
VKPTTGGEGFERRFFYGAIWVAAPAQGVLGLLWILLPHTHNADVIKFVIFSVCLLVLLTLVSRGLLPRTLPVIPEYAGQVMVE